MIHLTGEEMEHLMTVVRKGDILIRSRRDYADNFCIPGYFAHAALYIGNNYIIHADSRGVNKEHLLTFCQSCDIIAVLRVKTVSAYHIANIVEEAENRLGTEYDWFLNFDDDSRVVDRKSVV